MVCEMCREAAQGVPRARHAAMLREDAETTEATRIQQRCDGAAQTETPQMIGLAAVGVPGGVGGGIEATTERFGLLADTEAREERGLRREAGDRESALATT